MMKMINRIFVVNTRRRIIFFFVLASFVTTLIFTLYSYHVNVDIITGNITREMEQSITAVNQDIELKSDLIQNTLLAFLSNTTIKEALAAYKNKQINYLDAREILEEQMEHSLLFDYSWTSKLIDTIVIYDADTDGSFYFISLNGGDAQWVQSELNYLKNQQKEQMILLSQDRTKVIFQNNSINLYSLEHISKVAVFANLDSFSSSYEGILSSYDGSYSFIYDSDKQIFYHTDPSQRGKILDAKYGDLNAKKSIDLIEVDGKTYFLGKQYLKAIDMYSFILIPLEEMYSQVDNYVQRTISIMVVPILLSVLLALGISITITHPLNDLMRNLRKVKEGNYTIHMPDYRDTDLQALSVSFNEAVDQIKFLIEVVYENKLMLKDAELQSLRAQTNPHFYFNILEIISLQAQVSGNEIIYEMVNTLAELMRSRITLSGSEKNTVSEEMHYINLYLKLQKMRFRDKLTVMIQIDDNNCMDYFIPKLSIQPIVENAMVHGVEKKRGKGIIGIHIYVENDTLICKVTDNKGFDISELEQKKKQQKDKHPHIGITNTDRRIKLLYGDAYGISITSEPEVGTEVTICYPLDIGG